MGRWDVAIGDRVMNFFGNRAKSPIWTEAEPRPLSDHPLTALSCEVMSVVNILLHLNN